MAQTTIDHPVWSVYDRLRTARLNVKYYSRRLAFYERLNFYFDFILLIAAPSSSVAGLWFWKYHIGEIIWQYMGAIAAMVAVLKPILVLPKRIKNYESVLSGYRTLDFDLMEIKTLIEQRKKFDAKLRNELIKAIQRERLLVGKTPETHENQKIKTKCEAEVLRELPVDCFFIPED